MSKPQDETITLEDVCRYPLPGFNQPGSIRFSPDDSLITYLYSPDFSLTRELFAYSPQGGQTELLYSSAGEGIDESNVSLEEALRRERKRQMATGITSYSFVPGSKKMMIPLSDGLHIFDFETRHHQLLLEDNGRPILDPRFSPNGKWLAFVQDSEIHVLSAAGGEPRQVTWGAKDNDRTNGLAEFVAQEEMKRYHGYWWSPDSESIAYVEADESHIPAYRIVHQGKDQVGDAAQEDHRYPFAGKANAWVRLGVVPREGGEAVWMNLGEDEDIYLARVKWLSADRLSAQIENREQTRLDLIAFASQSGEGTLLHREENSTWINLHDMFRPLKNDKWAGNDAFIWASEKSGFNHLYLHDGDGNCVRQLTSGEWLVTSLESVDEERGIIYFMGTARSPLERHLYAVQLAGGEVRQITLEPGTHQVTIDHAKERFVDVYHSLDTPPTVSLRSLEDGSLLSFLFTPNDPRLKRLNLQMPELVTIENRTGEILHGAIYNPPGEYGEGPYPTIVQVYGGPHAQLVTQSWGVTVRMRAQYLRSQGFLVFVLDNQGSANRGLAFEGAIKHDMGHLEVKDQVDGIRFLVDQRKTDPDRVGIFGWSYGGYMTLMCMARAPETFKVGVAGAPVTDWDGYDTHYTERYMGMPKHNPDGYKRSSVMTHINHLRGKLMLVHGLIDENVHFRHSARLINALIAARKSYDLLLFPDERHSPRRLADRVFMEEQICQYFKKHLMERDSESHADPV